LYALLRGGVKAPRPEVVQLETPVWGQHRSIGDGAIDVFEWWVDHWLLVVHNRQRLRRQRRRHGRRSTLRRLASRAAYRRLDGHEDEVWGGQGLPKDPLSDWYAWFPDGAADDPATDRWTPRTVDASRGDTGIECVKVECGGEGPWWAL
jgi:hypothetical protein